MESRPGTETDMAVLHPKGLPAVAAAYSTPGSVCTRSSIRK